MISPSEPPLDLTAILAPERAEDAHFMGMALDEARMAWGRTSPNPMVGAVLVRDGRAVARGHHVRAGLDHGEVAALKDARERGVDPRGCVLYVNLEPCCVFGRTPPCTDALLDAGLSRVVAAMIDPSPRVQGRGLALLHAAGVEVTCGVLEGVARAFNAPFVTLTTLGRPHVTAKVAMSLDGKIATRTGDSFPMTGEEARRSVHKLRDRVDAILVGRVTAQRDDPRLTCRLSPGEAGPGGPRDPTRVLIDPELRLSPEAALLRLHASGLSTAQTWVIAASDVVERGHTLDAAGVEVIPCPRQEGSPALDLGILMEILARREICSLLVEGGGETLAGFARAGLIDAWIAHIAPILVGGRQAQSPLAGLGVAGLGEAIKARGPLRVRRLGDDIEIAAAVAGDVYGLD